MLTHMLVDNGGDGSVSFYHSTMYAYMHHIYSQSSAKIETIDKNGICEKGRPHKIKMKEIRIENIERCKATVFFVIDVASS